jgi:hypothetical protein
VVVLNKEPHEVSDVSLRAGPHVYAGLAAVY